MGRDFPYELPAVRSLKTYAFDALMGRGRLTRISLDVRTEPVSPGPLRTRIAVVDYDGSNRCFYPPLDLNNPAVLMNGGLDHSEGDPRFHQQMVYTVATRILELFDLALGRRVDFGERPLRLFPHAMAVANAFFDTGMPAVLFGYFKADDDGAGGNVPGQMLFSCLWHDVIGHEMTHAILHQLNPRLGESAHPDTHALHEALADLVPVFHRFGFRSIVRDEVRRKRGVLDAESPLVGFASNLGAAGQTLRSATTPPSPTQYRTVFGPHARGGLVVSAVLETLFETVARRVQDLRRIAGELPGGPMGAELHPQLVDRIADEMTHAANALCSMCLRALDYLPPAEATFGDFLRAAITADVEMVPNDMYGQRAALIEAFRRRGIYAAGVISLAEESLVWKRAPRGFELLPAPVVSALTSTAQTFRRVSAPREESARPPAPDEQIKALRAYARRHAAKLGLLPRVAIKVDPPRHVFRVAPDGQLVIEIVVPILQMKGGSIARAVTVIAGADGRVRHAIPSTRQPLRPLERAGAPAPPEAVEPAPPEGADPAPPEQARHLHRPEETKSPREPKPPEPFDRSWRIDPAKYRRAYPALAPSSAELARLNEIGDHT
jgi:hypothetical protein